MKVIQVFFQNSQVLYRIENDLWEDEAPNQKVVMSKSFLTSNYIPQYLDACGKRVKFGGRGYGSIPGSCVSSVYLSEEMCEWG